MNLFYLLKPKTTVAYLNKTHTIRQGLEKMKAHGYSAIPVIDDNGALFVNGNDIKVVSEGEWFEV